MNERAWRTDSGAAHGASLGSRPHRQIATPGTRHARCRAARGLVAIEPARPARQSLGLRPTWCHAFRGDADSQARGRAPARIRCARGPGTSFAVASGPLHSLAAFSASATHRAPSSCAPVFGEGDLWGDLRCGGPGDWLIASAANPKYPHHPSPTSSREGRGSRPPPPPPGGARKSEQKDQLRGTPQRCPAGRSVWSTSWLSYEWSNAMHAWLPW